MEDYPATETDDGRTLAIDVLYVVDVLGCLHALLFTPVLYGLAKTRSVQKSSERTQTGDGLLNLCLVLSRTLAKLWHLRE